MTLTVYYWVEHYEKETGWKQNEKITITGEEFFALSKKFDVAIMNNKNSNIPILAIDQLNHHFRQR